MVIKMHCNVEKMETFLNDKKTFIKNHIEQEIDRIFYCCGDKAKFSGRFLGPKRKVISLPDFKIECFSLYFDNNPIGHHVSISYKEHKVLSYDYAWDKVDWIYKYDLKSDWVNAFDSLLSYADVCLKEKERKDCKDTQDILKKQIKSAFGDIDIIR
jgi:hypothetical protein